MKKSILSLMRRSALCAIALTMAVFVSSCSKDEEQMIPSPQTFKGELITTLPSMPTFEAVACENTATMTWHNVEQTSASIHLDAFKLSMQTPIGERSYEIGAMNITNVPCSKSGSSFTISKHDFECQAGDFATKGTVEGTLTNGKLTLTIIYKPGTMPMDVQSVFTSK